MKIYCILFDALDHSTNIEKICKTKHNHYARQITNSYTTSSLWAMLSGKSSSHTGRHKLGWNTGYLKLSHKNPEKAKQVKNSMILNQLPDDWKFHIHGDANNVKYLTNNCCPIDNNLTYYTHTNYKDELKFLTKMENLDNNENHFIFIKYNHCHDAILRGESTDRSTNYMLNKLLPSINTKEENSLFWVFSDHGNFRKVGTYMNPPSAWITWVSITDNITKNKVTKDLVDIKDFYNTLYNRVYKTKKYDILDPTPKDKIYICDDGRLAINGDKHTTVCAIKRLDKDNYLQVSYHSPQKKFKTIKFNSKTNSITTVPRVEDMENYLRTNEGDYFD